MLRGTPFHSRTAPLCLAQNWRRWAGYVSASSYDLTHEREYHAIRSGVGLIDVSPLFKYRIRGRDAVALLNRVVTRDVEKLDVGQVYYTTWCDAHGKVRDDGTLHRLGETDLRLTSADPTIKWLHENAVGFDVTIEEETVRVGALALQGPRSRELLDDLTDGDVAGLKFFRVLSTQIGGVPVEVSRTGYTGDLGYEVWVDGARAEELWDAIVGAGGHHGLAPAGMLALDMTRVEAGLLLVEVDYVPTHRAVIEDQKSSPYELDLGWTVDLEKSNYVGRAALRAERDRPAAWHFRGLEIDWVSMEEAFMEVDLPPQVPGLAVRDSVPVYAGGEQVGYASSRSWSPTVKKYLGLAHLHAPYAEIGTELEIEITVEHRRRRARATVAKTPFYDPPRKRTTPDVS